MSISVFTDESSFSEGRYRAISAVSVPYAKMMELHDLVRCALEEAAVEEFKWRETKRAGKRIRLAQRLVELTLTRGLPEGMRVDTLVWDTEDSRHQIEGRDDIANFERMFYHLLRVLMRRRGAGTDWHIFPDEQHQIAWQEVEACLEAGGTWRSGKRTGLFPALLNEHPSIRTFRQVDSKKAVLCQVCDLFAGLATFTSNNSQDVKRLLEHSQGQGLLFGEDEHSSESASSGTRIRFSVVDTLYKGCLSRRLGVSLRTNGRFETRDPTSPINFWHYKPQHANDQAPRKRRVHDG